MSEFLTALLSMGVDPQIAQIVDQQFFKVDQNAAEVAKLSQQLGEVQSSLAAIQQQLSSLVDRGMENAAGIAAAENSAQILNQQVLGLTARVQAVEGVGVGRATNTVGGTPGGIPPGVKLEKPALYTGQDDDPAVLESFLFACELYFQLAGMHNANQQATLGLMWLTGQAAVWWQTIRHLHPTGQLQWDEFKSLLRAQFKPIDAARRARDAWVSVTQGKGTVRAFVDQFRRALLHVQDASPAEVLDRFVRGLAPHYRAQVLVQDPQDFERAALVAERVAGAHGEAPRGNTSGSGPVPMDLGYLGQPQRGYPSGSNREQSGRSNDKRTCHYCKQPGHFMLSCLKLKRDMEAKAAGRYPTRPAGRANQFSGLAVDEGAPVVGQPATGAVPAAAVPAQQENAAEQ